MHLILVVAELYKVDLSLSNKIVEWPVGKNPTGLFVNDSNNLLVTVRGDLILQEWTTQGSLIREVSLQQSGITSPWYSMQLRSGQFLIGDSSRLCCVDANGSLLSSHGNTAGSAIDQLNWPVGLVQGQNGSILIADRCNHRIMILNSSLSRARVLSLPADGKLDEPWALLLDESRGRLYVGEYKGRRVLIFDNVRI
jgi:hypothetical protein